MVLEVKSICSVESLRKISEIFGLDKDSNWLNSVRYALSVKTGTLVFAYETKIIVLSLKWDSRSHQSKYSITWSDELPPYDDITAVLCIPITNENEDIVAGILIGFASGKCQLITTRGQVIISQQWYPEPVQSIQLPNEKKSIDEIYVMYQSCLCILQSKQLMQSLKNFEKLNKTNSLLGSISCRVWKYGDSYGKSEGVVYSSVVGSKKIGLFDHLLAASMEGGFNASYRSSAPQQMSVLSVGVKPFAAFYYAKEIVVQPLVSVAIVQAVASQVKNALPSWFPGAQKPLPVTEPTPSISTESMILRYGFYDDHRIGNRIWMSPYNRLAAVADNLGRVILVDCMQNVVLRVWKGYRDAQCSFMKVDEKLAKTSTQQKRRHALFIAIYSPKRSTVDIWNVERGKKLAVFPAGPNGQLIQQNSYVTVSNMPSTSNSTVVIKPTYHSSTGAFFLNPIDLTIKELAIPFHYALDASNTKKSKDFHIINQIKADLKTIDPENMWELMDLCDSIQTNEMRFKCIGSIIKSRYLTPQIFEMILNTFLKRIDETDNNSDQEEAPTKQDNDAYSNIRLSKFLHKYERLLLFYNGMKQKSSHDDSNDSDEISDCDFDDILKVIEQYKVCLNIKKSKKVSIQSPTPTNSFIEYLSIFDCLTNDEIRLHESKRARFATVGFDLFDSYIRANANFDGFYKLANISTLSNVDLLKLFLKYWMEKDIDYENSSEVIHHLISFTHIIQMICDLNRSSAEHNYGALSPWWQNIREMLLQNSNVFKSLLAALLCRDLSVLYRQKDPDHDSNGEDDVWEQVSQEIAQWSLLIGKLDDIAALSSILSFKQNRSSTATDVIPLEYTVPDISLMTIFSGGNGIVSELVAKWIGTTGVKPSAFFTSSNVGEEIIEDYTPNSAVSYLDLLRKHFPFSLRSGVLLCHLAMEYVEAWNNNVEQFEYLSTAIEYLTLFDSTEFALKHGICCIIWNNILRKYIQMSIKIINNIGRSTDEPNQSAFNDTMISTFITHCMTFLNHLIESIRSQIVTLKFEELLQDGREPALATRANQQPRANMEIVELQSQLLEVLFIISSLNVSVKGSLNSLFNEASRELLASDISKELSESILRPDDTVNKSRKHFLHRTINVAVDLIRKDFQEVYLADFDTWIEKINLLSMKWTLNQEDLLKYQVIQLYSRGWDECAATKLNQIEQPSSMGKTLISITGIRLNNFVKDKPELYSRVLAIGSRISSYLETLDESSMKLPEFGEKVDDLTFVYRLQRLAKTTYECLAKQESSDLKLAAQLYDASVEIIQYLTTAEDS